jgi:hypothetical protein
VKRYGFRNVETPSLQIASKLITSIPISQLANLNLWVSKNGSIQYLELIRFIWVHPAPLLGISVIFQGALEDTTKKLENNIFELQLYREILIF